MARVFGNYRLIERIGQGGMGEVWRAEHVMLNRETAVKIIGHTALASGTDDEVNTLLLRFEREAKATSLLTSPHTIQIYDFGLSPNRTFFYAMELLQGYDLQSLIERHGPLPAERVLYLLPQICESLAEAHDSDLIHRDVKPGNIFVTTRGLKHDFVKVLDFGLVKVTRGATNGNSHLTATGIVAGSPAFMPPEAIRDNLPLDGRADIYSLGGVAYWLLTGQLPFEGSVPQLIAAHIETDPELPSARTELEIPADLEQIVMRCLAKKPQDRPQSARELMDLLAACDGSDAWNESRAAEWWHVHQPPNAATQRRGHVLDAASDRALEDAGLQRTERIGRTSSTTSRKAWRWGGFVAAAALSTVAVWALWQDRPRAPARAPQLAHKQLSFVGNAWTPAMSPDGEFVVYVQRNPGEQRLLLRERTSPRSVELLRGELVLDPRWSPDGSQIAVSTVESGKKFGLSIVPRLGGEGRRLGAGGYAAWSADGTKVARANTISRGFQIVDLSTGTTDSVHVDGFRWIHGIDWSWATNTIALSTTLEDGRYAVWTVAPNGEDAQNRFEDFRPLSCPRFSAGGTSLYVLRTDDNSKELLKIPLAGDRTPTTLLRGLQAGNEFDVTAAGDLVYTRVLEYSNLWVSAVVDSKPGSPRQITQGTRLLKSPSVSPSGESVAFVAGRANRNLHRLSLQTGVERQVTFFEGTCSSPAWAPTGASIAFVHRSEGNTRIGVVDAENGRARWHAVEASYEVVWVDDATVLYQKPGNQNFHFLDLRSGDERPLVREPLPGYLFDPAPSPDGNRVAVHWNRKSRDGSVPQAGLWLLDLRNSSETYVTPGLWRTMGWSEDGRWIYAWRQRDLCRVPVAGGEPEQLFSLPGEVSSAGVVPAGRPLVYAVGESISDVWLAEALDRQ